MPEDKPPYRGYFIREPVSEDEIVKPEIQPGDIVELEARWTIPGILDEENKTANVVSRTNRKVVIEAHGRRHEIELSILKKLS